MIKIFKDNPAWITGVVVFAVIAIAWMFKLGSFAPSYEEQVIAYAKNNGFKYIEPTLKRPREQFDLKGIHPPRSGLKIAFKDALVLVGIPRTCVAIFAAENSAQLRFQRRFPTQLEIFTRPSGKIGLLYASGQDGAWNCYQTHSMTRH